MSQPPIVWPGLPTVVEPLVRRHAEDAAFYWTQLDGGSQATGLSAQRLAHFERLLEAHLEGLRIAGGEGARLTQEGLTRWRKPGEAFAASVSAVSLASGTAACDAALEPLLPAIRRAPEMLLRGLISALAWTDLARVEPWLRASLAAEDDVVRVAALRASALHGLPIPQWDEQAAHPSSHVRAAACRAAGEQHLAQLGALHVDVDLQVRAESVLAFARLVPENARGTVQASQAASLLWRCVIDQIKVTEASTGWYRLQSRRRLDRWLHQLAWLAPLGHPGIPQLLAQLPPRLALSFVLYHGDAKYMPFVINAMGRPDAARWAMWVWCCLTGVSSQTEGLTLPDASPDLDAALSDVQQDADRGLPLPNPSAVANHSASRISTVDGQRLLMGRAVQATHLRELLDPAADQPQALRFVAAHALSQLHPAYAVNLRASPSRQSAHLARMGIKLEFS